MTASRWRTAEASSTHEGPTAQLRAFVVALVVGPLLCAPSALAVYDLAPLTQADPSLSRAWSLMSTDAKAAIAAAVSIEREEADSGLSTSWRSKAALYIAGQSAIELGQIEACESAIARLRAKGAHSFVDDLTSRLSRRYESEGRFVEAATLALTISPNHEGALKAYPRHLKALAGVVPVDALLATIDRLTSHSLTRSGRETLNAHRLEILDATGQEELSRQQRLQQWWTSTSEKSRASIAKALERRKQRLTYFERLTRAALKVPKRDVKSFQRSARRVFRARTKVQKRYLALVKAYLDSGSRDSAERAEERVRRGLKGLEATEAHPWSLYLHAITLRRLNRDVEAARVYIRLADRYPSNLLASDALVEASGLLTRRGLATEAQQVRLRAQTMSLTAGQRKQVLWELSLGFILRGDYASARPLLERYDLRFGGERDGVGTSLGARAAYWQARMAHLEGARDAALMGYQRLATTFPMGWYGQLAARRRAQLESKPLFFGGQLADDGLGSTAVRVEPAPHLDLAVLLIRSGEFKDAKGLLNTLLNVGRLRGAERRLLALVYRRLGEDDRADSMLVRRGVLSSVVRPDQRKLYETIFPLRYQKHLKAAARVARIPASMLAALVYVESRFNPAATSGVGAIGLAQLMPSTARSVAKDLYGVKSISKRRIRKPKVNLTLGATLLAQLGHHFRDHPAPVMAGYNAGRGASRSWLRARGHLPLDAFVETIPYQQTRRYVMRVIALTEVYRRLYRLDESPLDVDLRLPLTVSNRPASSPAPGITDHAPTHPK